MKQQVQLRRNVYALFYLNNTLYYSFMCAWITCISVLFSLILHWLNGEANTKPQANKLTRAQTLCTLQTGWRDLFTFTQVDKSQVISEDRHRKESNTFLKIRTEKKIKPWVLIHYRLILLLRLLSYQLSTLADATEQNLQTMFSPTGSCRIDSTTVWLFTWFI